MCARVMWTHILETSLFAYVCTHASQGTENLRNGSKEDIQRINRDNGSSNLRNKDL